MKIFKTFNDDPNFSIVMPGGCNAECAFCFNRDKRGKKADDPTEWLLGLYKTLESMPKQFYQIAITGNEPMLSPLIDGVLTVCRKARGRYTNILLTTNGTNLLEQIKKVSESVHHINVSRHHYDEVENLRIFGGQYRVSDENLVQIIDRYSALGVDVSLNCVIDDKTDTDFIYKYVDFAKHVGAKAVRFRKQNGDNLAMTACESELAERYPIIERHECPVCRTWKRIIGGMDTFWKAATIEPSDKIRDEVYELVYNTDGVLYLDWDYKKPFNPPEYRTENRPPSENYYNVSPYNSCGGGVRTSC